MNLDLAWVGRVLAITYLRTSDVPDLEKLSSPRQALLPILLMTNHEMPWAALWKDVMGYGRFSLQISQYLELRSCSGKITLWSCELHTRRRASLAKSLRRSQIISKTSLLLDTYRHHIAPKSLSFSVNLCFRLLIKVQNNISSLYESGNFTTYGCPSKVAQCECANEQDGAGEGNSSAPSPPRSDLLFLFLLAPLPKGWLLRVWDTHWAAH